MNLPEEDVTSLDAYAQEKGLPSHTPRWEKSTKP
jgi:hypothetical protein